MMTQEEKNSAASNPKPDQVAQVREFLYGSMRAVDASIDQVARRSTPMTPKK